MINIYDFESYREYIKRILEENKTSRGFQSQLAKAANCQVSYFSQVLSSKAELTPDHALGIANFLNLSESDTEYFLNLINYSRASTISLKQHLKQRLNILRTQAISSEHKVSIDYTPLTEEATAVLHSSWVYSAILSALYIPSLRTTASISKKFNLRPEKANEIMDFLEKNKLIEKNNQDEWQIVKVVVSNVAKVNLAHVIHQRWNEKACIDIENKNPESIHNLFTYAFSENDLSKAKKILTEALKKIHEIAVNSTDIPSKIYCYKSNFFEIN